VKRWGGAHGSLRHLEFIGQDLERHPLLGSSLDLEGCGSLDDRL
jgi:hypothetical protein